MPSKEFSPFGIKTVEAVNPVKLMSQSDFLGRLLGDV